VKRYTLTPEHRAELPGWADRWIANAMSTAPMTDEDRAICVDAVHGLYRAANLPPPKHIIFVASPFVLAFAGGFAAARWHLSKAGAQIAAIEATDAATRSATDAATRSATYAATRSATDAATYAATYAATDAATVSATVSATRSATDAATVSADYSQWYVVPGTWRVALLSSASASSDFTVLPLPTGCGRAAINGPPLKAT
jgi:hypothetical protein